MASPALSPTSPLYKNSTYGCVWEHFPWTSANTLKIHPAKRSQRMVTKVIQDEKEWKNEMVAAQRLGQIPGATDVCAYAWRGGPLSPTAHALYTQLHKCPKFVSPGSFFAMDIPNGGQSIYQLGPMTMTRALQLANGIMKAVDFLHQHGLAHNDVHVHNLVVDAQNTVRLIDFSKMTEVDKKNPIGKRMDLEKVVGVFKVLFRKATQLTSPQKAWRAESAKLLDIHGWKRHLISVAPPSNASLSQTLPLPMSSASFGPNYNTPPGSPDLQPKGKKSKNSR